MGIQSDVQLYTLSTCGHCRMTKKFISDCGVEFVFTDVDLLDGEERKAVLDDVRKINPKCSFPTIKIGNKVIVGFREDKIKEALDLL